jgi:hypothetical protein
MEFRNDDLLQLVECIESTQNEVKRKMVDAEARNDSPKSPALRVRKKMFVRDEKNAALCVTLCLPRYVTQRTDTMMASGDRASARTFAKLSAHL